MVLRFLQRVSWRSLIMEPVAFVLLICLWFQEQVSKTAAFRRKAGRAIIPAAPTLRAYFDTVGAIWCVDVWLVREWNSGGYRSGQRRALCFQGSQAQGPGYTLLSLRAKAAQTGSRLFVGPIESRHPLLMLCMAVMVVVCSKRIPKKKLSI